MLFKKNYPSTYIILDASEIIIDTPSDLQIQSSTWSNYKHHNTFKFLVGCTPNGALSFISALYMGSISDIKLTRVSGVVEKLRGKEGISVMAYCGFTIQDQLSLIDVNLNIPPFLEGRTKLPAKEVLEGRKIASVRVHVERAISRIKCFHILKGTLPITLSRIANQIAYSILFIASYCFILLYTYITYIHHTALYTAFLFHHTAL